MVWLSLFVPRLQVHGNATLLKVFLDLAYGEYPEVEDRRRENSLSMTLHNGFVEMFQ